MVTQSSANGIGGVLLAVQYILSLERGVDLSKVLPSDEVKMVEIIAEKVSEEWQHSKTFEEDNPRQVFNGRRG